MLSRRHLRIKVLQALYSFFQSDNDNIIIGEKQLIQSIEKLIDLRTWHLSSIIEIADFARKRIEEAKLKNYPTEEDLNPNTRFVDNLVIAQLESNRDLERRRDLLKINWSEEQGMIRKLFLKIKESKQYENYMSEPEGSYELDKDALIKIYKKQIAKSDSMLQHYEDKSIFWADDQDIINTIVIKTLKSFNQDWTEISELPMVFDFSRKSDNEELDFLLTLFRKTIVNTNSYDELITAKAHNWEFERIAIMDIILIKMALVELMEFSSIPVKVTLNEYIEISKDFSTPKSSVFVNGILDKLITELKAQNKIKKTGRGLLNN